MPTQPKIRIPDNPALRRRLDALCDGAGMLVLSAWAMELARRCLRAAGFHEPYPEAVEDGFRVLTARQRGEARMHDVRQAGFRIHALAREGKTPLETAALRTAGQAVGTGHMGEHAMVASDYAVRVMSLLYPGRPEAVTAERERQIQSLIKMTAV